MSCTKEEIERKRLVALQKRQSKLSSLNNVENSPIKLMKLGQGQPNFQQRTTNVPMKNINHNTSQTFHPYDKPETSNHSFNNVMLSKVVSGTVYLISDDRFEVNPSEFCGPLINVFKTIPSKNYGEFLHFAL